ncbi:MAG: DUF547 domain-containing protein [Crocinitomicaceae bacterium]
MDDLNTFSEKLLLAVKMQESYASLLNELAGLDESIFDQLKSDNQKLAFWVNIYNSFYQIIAVANPGLGKSIFTEKRIKVAQTIFSLDDIEHGILRLGSHKYSLGFWKSIWIYKHVKKYRPSRLDFRIHFALNCGAKSCPPIAFYSVDNLNEQLNLSSASFLESETIVNPDTRVLTISKLFLWFRKDFGGRVGIDDMFKTYINLNTLGFKIKYADYDWSKELLNFK